MKEKTKQGNTILVTGGCGFIGSYLSSALVSAGHTVISIDNLRTGAHINDKVKNYFCDITDLKSLDAIFKSEKPEYIFHLAARSRINPVLNKPVDHIKDDLGGTLCLLELAQKYNIKKVIYASSSAIYGNCEPPFSEDKEVFPETPYALSKYLCENLMSTYYRLNGLPTVSFRFFNVYGPNMSRGQNRTFITAILEDYASSGKVIIYGDGEQKRDFIHVSDVVNALIMSMGGKKGLGEVFNLGSGKAISLNELCHMLIENPGIEYQERGVQYPLILADTTKIKKVFGWSPEVDIETGIKEVAAEFFGVEEKAK